MESITLDYKTWGAGISTADGKEDGGYSPKYGGHNIHEEKDDLLYPQMAYNLTSWGADPEDFLDGNTTQYPVIYVKNQLFKNFTNSELGILISDDGSVYSHTSLNRMTDEAGLSAANIVFDKYGHEDGVYFQDDIYFIAEDNIALIGFDANGNRNSVDSDWWTNVRGHGAISAVKCNAVVIEDTAYFIERNYIHIWDGSSSQENALTLPLDFYATAAIKHPNGRDLIVLGSQKEVDDEIAGVGFKAYYINTTDLEFTDEIPIDREVHGIWNVAGTLYVTSYDQLGIFTGSGIEPIYRLDAAGLKYEASPADDVRQYLIRTIHGAVTDQGYLLLPDGAKVLAVGKLGNGTVMWHPADLTGDITRIHTLFNMGNKYVGIWGYNGTDFTPADIVSTRIELDRTDGTAKWASNKIRFNQHVWVRRIEIEHQTLESGDDFSVGHIEQDGTEVTDRQVTYATYGAIGRIRIDVNIYTDVYQYLHTWTAGAVGVRKITIWYENAE